MEVIDKNRYGIALITDNDGLLLGTVTDGDIRRYILSERSIDEPILNMMWNKPVTISHNASEKDIRELMNKNLFRNIPILDDSGRPCNIVHIEDFTAEKNNVHCAVIMAGGEGKRLRPITEDTPKPMVKVGGKPILEKIIDCLAKSEISNIYISLNYKADLIEEYFKDGSGFGVNISYLKEDKKLGTAGALTLLKEVPSQPLLVINGDVLTMTSFHRLLEFHKHHRCVMTVAATQYMLKVPFGVLNLTGHYLLGIEEKPEQRFLCNAGIYIVEPEMLSLIPNDSGFDMTDLVNELIKKGLPIATFPIHEYWIDIGQMDDLEKAQKDIKL
jgi:dTDP-glucose pyrophosphorylase